MKRMHHLWLIGLLLSIVSLSGCSNTDNPYLPDNPDIVTSFDNMYPNAQDVYWSKKGVYYVADCRVDGTELDVWFNEKAAWVMTEEDIFRSQLPDAVNTSYENGKYGNWVIDDQIKLTFPSSPTTVYFLEVQSGDKENALYYMPDGTLTLTQEITNGNYTIWPTVFELLGQ